MAAQRLRFFAFLAVFCVRAFAAEPDAGRLNVKVRGRSSGESVPARAVYLALIPMDQPASRPALEAIGDGGVQWRDVAPGEYGLIAEARAFDPAFVRVEIVAGKSQEVSVELEPQFELTGTVVDAAGGPVARATVCHSRVATAALMNSMSRLAHRKALEDLCARTNANGWWKLAVPAARATDLFVEAAGFEPTWVRREPAINEMPAITLRRGSSLRVLTNRAAPDLTLALIPTAPIASPIPAWAQKSVWGREVATTTVEWTSLPAGEYDLVASWPDPRRFSAPVTLRHVSVASGGNAEVQIALPDEPPRRSKTVRIFVSPKTGISDLRAFVRSDSGATRVAAAAEQAPRGRVLYADADAGPADVFFTTAEEVILAVARGYGAANREAAVEGIKFPKAEGKLRVGVPEGGKLPLRGNATFHECSKDARYVLPVNVAKSGDVSLPLLVGCSALTLRFDPYSPLAFVSRAAARDDVWLGAHTLKASASAEIHVVQEPSGANVAEALVTALVERGPGKFLEVVKRVAGADGRVVIEGLPAGEEITFRAEDTATKLKGTVRQVLEPAQRALIDPLPLPAAAELTVIPRFDENFKGEFPNVEIVGVVADGEGTENRSVELTGDQHEAVFRGLEPGPWKIVAMIRMSGITQPMDAATLTLKSGDREKIEPVIRPLVIAGHVTSHGRGVKTSLSITDPPGPGAITRRVFATEDGAFHAILPRPGVYVFSARRKPNDPDVELAPIRFDGSVRDVQIALPEGAIAVRVVSGASGDAPVPGADLAASMLIDGPEQRGFYRLERKDQTNSNGEAVLDELQEGTWLVTARTKDGSVAERTVVVSRDRAATVTLNLDRSVVEGVVVDGTGTPAGFAAVDCIYSGSGNIPRIVRSETDSRGRFSIAIAKPAPERVLCGVTTMDGAIGAFITALGSDARFALSPSTSVLTITNWSDRASRDRFWLVASDGGLFDLSWAARKLRRLDAPLTLAKVPAGAWSVVHVDSPGAFDVLARGGAEALPRLARLRIPAGQSHHIDMQNGDSSAPK